MKVDYSAYEGFEVQGFTETVLSRGRVIIEDTNLVTKGGGQFIKRARAGELLR
jgi:dihydropyrimidinase